MGKVTEKKNIKKSSLLDSAFHLFTTQGFADTSIAQIADKAGIAKGTFYLYFRDKFDLRNKLISYESGKLLQEAHKALISEAAPVEGFENQLLYICDYILMKLQKNKALLNFIAKNLSWGIFRDALSTNLTEEDDISFRSAFIEIVKNSGMEVEEPEIMLFLIIEMIGSTAYSSILYEEPTDLETLMPYLHKAIHSIIANHVR